MKVSDLFSTDIHQNISNSNNDVDESLAEGSMKRSDPYISGESSNPTRSTVKSNKTYDTKILNLAKKGKTTPENVEAIWKDEKEKVSDTHPNRWAIVMNNVKKRLNVT